MLTLADIKRPKNKSGWYGVYWYGPAARRKKPWVAKFAYGGQHYFIGSYRTPESAAKSVRRALVTLGKEAPGRRLGHRTCNEGHPLVGHNHYRIILANGKIASGCRTCKNRLSLKSRQRCRQCPTVCAPYTKINGYCSSCWLDSLQKEAA